MTCCCQGGDVHDNVLELVALLTLLLLDLILLLILLHVEHHIHGGKLVFVVAAEGRKKETVEMGAKEATEGESEICCERIGAWC